MNENLNASPTQTKGFAFYITDETMLQNGKILFNKYEDSNSSDLLEKLKYGRFFLNPELINIVLFHHIDISIPIPSSSKPLKYFPSLKVDINDDNFGKTSALIFVSNESKTSKMFSCTFHHARDFSSPLKLVLPFDAVDATNFKEDFLKIFNLLTWKDVIFRFMKDLGMINQDLILSYAFEGESNFLSPSKSVRDFFSSFFVGDTFEMKGTFYYDFPIPLKFEKDLGLVYSLMEKIHDCEPSTLLTLIIESIRPFFSSNAFPLPNDKRDKLCGIIDFVVSRYFFSFFHNKGIKVPFPNKPWCDYCETIKSTNLDENTKDVEYQIALCFVYWGKLTEDIVDCYNNVRYFIAKKNAVQNIYFSQTIIYSKYVNIPSQKKCNLILSLGFFHLLDIEPSEKGFSEILPLKFKFKASSSNLVLFGHPIQDILFAHVGPRSTLGVVLTPKGTITLNFYDNYGNGYENSYEDIHKFWVLLEVCKDFIKEPILLPPFLPHTSLHLSYPSISNACEVININIEAAECQWKFTMSLKEYLHKLTKISELKRTMVSLENGTMSVNDIVGLVFERDTVYSNIIEKNKTSISDDEDRILADSATKELTFTRNEEDAFLFFKLIGVADFNKSFLLHSAQLLQFQLKYFKQHVSSYRLRKTPLLHFVTMVSDDIKLMQILIDNVDLFSVDEDHRSALFYSLLNPSKVVTQMLVHHYGDTSDLMNCNSDLSADYGDFDCFTPVTGAIDRAQADMVDFLMQHNASANKMLASFHKSALVYSLMEKNMEIFEKIIDFSDDDLNFPNEYGYFLTHICIDMKMNEPFYILAKHCDRFEPNRHIYGRPHPLHYFLDTISVSDFIIDLFSALISLPNLDLNVKNTLGQTPLCRLINFNAATFVERLAVDPRCDLDLQNENGQSPLSLAVSIKNVAIAESLLKNGALVNMPNSDEMQTTPLMQAVSQNNEEMVRILLDFNAKPNAWYNGKGMLPNQIASPEILKIIESHCGLINEEDKVI